MIDIAIIILTITMVMLLFVIGICDGPRCKKCWWKKLKKISPTVCTDSCMHISLGGNAHYETLYVCPRCGKKYVYIEILEH